MSFHLTEFLLVPVFWNIEMITPKTGNKTAAITTSTTTTTTTILWPFVWDYLCELVPEETFTHSHIS